MATYLWYNFFITCFVASWGFIMFKNLKSKLESKIETKLKSAVVEQPARPVTPNVVKRQDGNVTQLRFDVAQPIQRNIKSLGVLNPQYVKPTIDGTRRNEYEYINYTNKPIEFDNNMVLINHVCVGSVPDGCKTELADILANKKITSTHASIHSGNYMLITEDNARPLYNTIGVTIRIRYK